MAYIDPDGMFHGDRMSLLSDEAKILWPHFWCASNTLGRIELNYRKVIGRAFGHFTKKPTESQFKRCVEQYAAAYLLYVYEFDGQTWGQWDVSERYLPDYKTAIDRRTPAPLGSDYIAWKNAYIAFKKGGFAKSCVANNSGVDRTKALGSGIGSGNGIGKEEVKTFPAKTAGERSGNLFEVEQLKATEPSAEKLAEAYAPQIHERHPPRRRDLGVNGVKKALVVILKAVPRTEREPLAKKLNSNHEGWCESYGWLKENGEYAKALSNWLAPTKGRWEVEPPPRDPPPSSSRSIKSKLLEEETLRQIREEVKDGEVNAGISSQVTQSQAFKNDTVPRGRQRLAGSRADAHRGCARCRTGRACGRRAA